MTMMRKVSLLLLAQACGHCVMRFCSVAAIFCACISVASAIDVPDPSQVISQAKDAGEMKASAVWALFAGTLALGQVGLGWFILTAQTAVQTKLNDIATDIAAIKVSKPNCAGAEAVNSMLNTARTELERTAILLRNGK